MSNFDLEKKHVLKDYKKALENNQIDSGIVQILNLINSHPDYYSTSSCSGRILLLALAKPGSKTDSIMLGRWHEPIEKEQLKEHLIKWKIYPYLFFLTQSPIFHITTHTLPAAILLRNIGEAAGFKYSSIRSIKPIKLDKTARKKYLIKDKEIDLYSPQIRITVELLSTERLNLPLGHEGKIYADDEYLELLVDLANNSLSEANKKVKKLETVLRKELKVC